MAVVVFLNVRDVNSVVGMRWRTVVGCLGDEEKKTGDRGEQKEGLYRASDAIVGMLGRKEMDERGKATGSRTLLLMVNLTR